MKEYLPLLVQKFACYVVYYIRVDCDAPVFDRESRLFSHVVY